MRCDQLYNVGGFDPDHPSSNVLDELLHEDEAAGRVRARHYDVDGVKLRDRRLTEQERLLLCPRPGIDPVPDPVAVAAIRALGDADVAERLRQRPKHPRRSA